MELTLSVVSRLKETLEKEQEAEECGAEENKMAADRQRPIY